MNGNSGLASSLPLVAIRTQLVAAAKAAFPGLGAEDGDCLELAFSKKRIEDRKSWLAGYAAGTFLDQAAEDISYSDFINKVLLRDMLLIDHIVPYRLSRVCPSLQTPSKLIAAASPSQPCPSFLRISMHLIPGWQVPCKLDCQLPAASRGCHRLKSDFETWVSDDSRIRTHAQMPLVP